jgi:putative peptidoglycan lipid II flippase
MDSIHAVRGAVINFLFILLSRVFGLLRDVLMVAFLGMGPVVGAFQIAWVIPNLFRRLFGEGAVSSAIQPALARATIEGGEEKAKQLFLGIQTTLFVFLLTFCGIAWLVVFFWPIDSSSQDQSWVRLFTLILLPYLIPICMCALAAAPQNLNRRFFWPAFAPLILNIIWICALWLFTRKIAEPALQLQYLCFALVFGGLVQWKLQFFGLRKLGLYFGFFWKTEWIKQKQVFLDFLPAFIGLAGLQLNLLVDQFLVRELVGPEANNFTYLSNRLIQFPLALIGIAAMTGAMPLLSDLAAKKDFKRMNLSLRSANEACLTLMLCALAGLYALSLPVLQLLFEHGAVTAEDSVRLTETLQAYLWILPIAGWNGLLIRACNAVGAYRFAMFTSLSIVPVNLFLDWLWLPQYGVPAAGWATTVSLTVQGVLLGLGLKKYKLKIPLAFSSLPSCVIPSIITYLVATYVFAVSNLLFAILVGFLAAMSMIFLLRRADMTSLLHAVTNRYRNSKGG